METNDYYNNINQKDKIKKEQLKEKLKREIENFEETKELNRDYDTRPTSSHLGAEGSPYWGYLKSGINDSHSQYDGRTPEPMQGNPDSAESSETPWMPRYTEKQQEKLQSIQDSFSYLTDIERRIIVLIYTEALSQEEIANRLKVSQQYVSSSLKSAKKKIYKIYSSKNGLTGH